MADLLNPTTKDKIDKSVMTAGNPQAQLTPNLLKGMAILDNMVRNNMIQDYQNQQLAQQEQQPPALQRGLLYPVEKVDAMIQGRPDESVQQEIAQQQPRMTLNQLARRFANDVIDSKLLWEEGAKAGNEQVMQLAHNGAEQARAGLQQLGYDPQAYGLNDDLAAAQQNLARNDLQALQNTLYGEMAESSGARFRRLYNVLLDRGVSHDIAKELAAKHSSVYSDNRKQALTEAFHTYGHDNTTINPMGEQLLEMIADEDIQAAEGLAKPYANPLNEYGKQNAIDMAAIAQSNKEKNAAIGLQNDLTKMDVADQQTLRRMGVQHQYNVDLKNIDARQKEAFAQNRFVERVNLEGLKAQYKAAAGGKVANGITDQQAKLAHEGIKEINRQLENNMNLSDADKQDLMNQRAQLQAIINSYERIGQKGGSVLSGVDVNDYNSLSRAYQQIVERNAAAYEKNDPNDPPMSWDELNRAFLKEVGEDNPMALNIIENSPYKTGSSSSGAASTSAPARPSAPQVVYLPATESGDNPGGYADDYGTRGNIPLVRSVKDFVSNAVQNSRKGNETEAGRMAARRFGIE